MKKQTQLAVVASILLSGGALSASAECYLVVESAHEGNAPQEVTLTTESRVVFSDTSFDVLPNEVGSPVTFKYGDVSSLRFSSTSVGVNSVKGELSSLRLASNPVAVELQVLGHDGSAADCFVSDMSGKVIWHSAAWQGEGIDVSALTPGLYFVTINSTTIKFIKK